MRQQVSIIFLLLICYQAAGTNDRPEDLRQPKREREEYEAETPARRARTTQAGPSPAATWQAGLSQAGPSQAGPSQAGPSQATPLIRPKVEIKTEPDIAVKLEPGIEIKMEPKQELPEEAPNTDQPEWQALYEKVYPPNAAQLGIDEIRQLLQRMLELEQRETFRPSYKHPEFLRIENRFINIGLISPDKGLTATLVKTSNFPENGCHSDSLKTIKLFVNTLDGHPNLKVLTTENFEGQLRDCWARFQNLINANRALVGRDELRNVDDLLTVYRNNLSKGRDGPFRVTSFEGIHESLKEFIRMRVPNVEPDAAFYARETERLIGRACPSYLRFIKPFYDLLTEFDAIVETPRDFMDMQTIDHLTKVKMCQIFTERPRTNV